MGMTQRDDMGREVGGGFRIGNSCTPVADSCQCMAKPIQHCKVKQSKIKKERKKESIIMNKASGGDGIPTELFQILKDDAVQVLLSIYSKFRKLSSGHRAGKSQLSFQSQRKAMPKNAQTTAQSHTHCTHLTH